MTSQCVKNKEDDARQSPVAWLFFNYRYMLWCFQWSVTVHMRGKTYIQYIPVIYLFYTIKVQMVYKKSCLDFWSMKNEKQVWWRDLTWIWRQLCVSSNTLWPMCTGLSHYCHVINRSEVEMLPTYSPIDVFLIIYSRLIPSINSFLTS